MFVRKKPNKSGSVSVQVVVKTRSRRQKVIKSIGCNKDPKRIERLMTKSSLSQRVILGMCDEQQALCSLVKDDT